MGDPNETADVESAKPDEHDGVRERSGIEFPYSDLENAIEIARTLRDRAGTSCEPAQLAGWLGHSVTGGTFRSRLSAARIFGLVETRPGKIALTARGRDILEPTKARAARVSAFLSVPLYSALFEKYNGYTLPPVAAIERQAVEAGVPPKQSGRARQVFMKSAAQANFVDPNSGRLIKPSVEGVVEQPPAKEESKPKQSGGGGGDGGGGDQLDPIVVGLLARLPRPGAVWPEAARATWLDLLKGSFKLIYLDDKAGGDASSKRRGRD
jgi:hypothetical protein